MTELPNCNFQFPIARVGLRRMSISRYQTASRAFTFVEVLFAIVILGIGMIMIAGILPVAIKQQADTRDDLTAKAVCESGYAYLSAIVQSKPDAFVPTNFSDADNNTPQGNFSAIRPLRALLNTGISGGVGVDEELAGKVVPLNGQVIEDVDLIGTVANPGAYRAFNACAHSRIDSTDPRFQYLAFYRRDQGAASLRLIIVALKLQNTEAVKGYGLDASSPDSTVHKEMVNDNNGPFLCEVEIKDQTLEPDRIVFTTLPSAPVLGEGAFVIIADSRAISNGTDRGRPFRNNGRVFQLGQQRLDLDSSGKTWELTSSYDLQPASVGADGLENTADDLVDGSMDTSGSYVVDGNNIAGTSAQAWVIGKGLYNPTLDASNNNKYVGRVQDIGVLVADVPLR